MNKLLDFIGCAWELGVTPADKWQIFWRQSKNVRVRLKLARYHPQTTYSLNTHFGRLTFRDNFGDITNLTNLLYRKVYCWTQLRNPGPIYDVGANIGLASVWFSRFNPDCPIICFEPLPENTALIVQNCPQARIVNAAAGSGPGFVLLNTDADGVMASSVPNPYALKNMSFPVVSLDQVSQEMGIRLLGLLKIDAEGMEVEILKGAASLLERVGQIVIETHGIDRHQACLEILESNGFIIERQQFATDTGLIFAVSSQ